MDRSSIERILGGTQGTLLTYLPGGMLEAKLEKYALAALPSGTPAEITEFKLYWRNQIWRQRECMDREFARTGPSFADVRIRAALVAASKSRRRGRRDKDPELSRLRNKVRGLGEARFTQAQMVTRLDEDNVPRPPTVAWRHLNWRNALKSNKFGNSVRKWLSNAGR